MSQAYKPQGTLQLFSKEKRLANLSKQGDPLEKLQQVIDWEQFRPLLHELAATGEKTRRGARPYDPLLMFKILILQRYYNLSDDQVEYQITDRRSFSRFLGLSEADRIPEAKTIWHFREKLSEKGGEKQLFSLFLNQLKSEGLIANEGKIVDASFVAVPKQRNKKEENKHIKTTGQAPEAWKEKPAKLAQKDVDARWTKKNKETHYGYKNHVKIDQKSKLIEKYTVTNAAVHDSQALDQLLDESQDANNTLHADSAYSGQAQAQLLEEKGLENQVHEKGYRNNPLTEEQKQANKEKSKIRARVEHVFGFMTNSMNGLFSRCIGQSRTHTVVGLMNLVYNMFRYEQLVRIHGHAVYKLK